MEDQSPLPSKDSSTSFWHTEPSSLLSGHRSTRELPKRVDVVVVGAGISGVSVAHHLLNDDGHDKKEGEEDKEKGGVSVLVLEAREVCWGATGRNGGHCQPLFYQHPSNPSIGAFELANLHALETLTQTRQIPCEFHTQPGIRGLYSSLDVVNAKASVAILKARDAKLGNLVHVIEDEEELKKLRLPSAYGAVVTDVAARLWPYKFVARVLEDLLVGDALERGTLNLQTHTPVTGLSRGEGGKRWHVETPRGSVIAGNVVLATNAYTSHLLPLFADLIVPCRGQMSALLPCPALSGSNRLSTSFGFLGPKQDDYLIQRPRELSEHLMFGGGRSDGPSLGETDDSIVDPKVAKYLRRALIHLHGLEDGTTELKATHEWTGIMGFSRDDLPWVGPVPESSGVYVVAGYTGHGMPNAWLCGKAVSKMVREKIRGVSDHEAVQAAVSEGLPQAYVVDETRLQKARQLDSVAKQDEAHMFKAEFVE